MRQLAENLEGGGILVIRDVEGGTIGQEGRDRWERGGEEATAEGERPREEFAVHLGRAQRLVEVDQVGGHLSIHRGPHHSVKRERGELNEAVVHDFVLWTVRTEDQ